MSDIVEPTDYAELARTPLGKITLGDLGFAILWLLALIPVGRAVISLAYQAKGEVR